MRLGKWGEDARAKGRRVVSKEVNGRTKKMGGDDFWKMDWCGKVGDDRKESWNLFPQGRSAIKRETAPFGARG